MQRPAALVLAASLLLAPAAGAVDLAEIAHGLDQPLAVADPGDGSGRLFVAEQTGRVRVVRGGTVLPRPFLDLSRDVACCGEQGLLGLAFDARYRRNGYFYVDLTDRNGDTEVRRYRVSADPERSRAVFKRLLAVAQPYANHNGGGLAFHGGALWIATGDGGSGGDPGNRAQDPASLLGKILRVDRQGRAVAGNPFVGRPGDDRIWAWGLRNPFRFSFDRATGDLWIGDVGQNAWEEVDLEPAGSAGGRNYGWSCREGRHPYDPGRCADGRPLVEPVLEYGHDRGCAVTGGYRYRGRAIPSLAGAYVFADFCSGTIWAARPDAAGRWSAAVLLESGRSIASFGEDAAGELLVVDLGGGALLRLVP